MCFEIWGGACLKLASQREVAVWLARRSGSEAWKIGRKIEKFRFFSNVTKRHQMVGNGHKSGPECILGSEIDSKDVLWVQIGCWGVVFG